jgi:hypothetical protein
MLHRSDFCRKFARRAAIMRINESSRRKAGCSLKPAVGSAGRLNATLAAARER